MKRMLLAVFAVGWLAAVATGCHTAHGFGEDVRSAGQSLQSAAH